MGVVVRRYIDFIILLIPTPLVSVLFCSSIPTFIYVALHSSYHFGKPIQARTPALRI